MKWFIALSPVVGLVALFFARKCQYRRAKFLREATPRQGTVVALEPDDDVDYGKIEVALPDHKTVTIRSLWASSPPAFSVGETVSVHHNEAMKPHFVIDQSIEIWGHVRLLYGVAAAGLAAPLVVMLVSSLRP